MTAIRMVTKFQWLIFVAGVVLIVAELVWEKVRHRG